jgi:transcriptional regulator with XRE-family HTH domain
MANRKGLTPEQNARVREALRDLLKRHGDNQSKLAQKLGVAQPTISHILGGQGTSYQTAGRIADALGVDAQGLLGGAAQQPEVPRHPRARAADLAREDGVYEGAIAAVLAEEVSPEHAARSTLWWANRMKHRERELLDQESGEVRREWTKRARG